MQSVCLAELHSSCLTLFMRQDLHNLNMRELLDLLVEKTQQLSRMKEDRIGGSALEDCKNTVKELQNIIQTRKVISQHIRKNKRSGDGG